MMPESWPERLHDFIESRRDAAFCWGVNDCCLFAADAVLAMTGVDLAAHLRGTYFSEFGAAKVIFQHGGVPGVVDLQPIPVLMAGRGDVVCISTDYGDALAICLGGQLVAVTQQGLTFMPMSNAKYAWRTQTCLQ